MQQPSKSAVLAERLRGEGASTLGYLRSLERSAWGKELYGSNGRWRLRELLAHLIAAEQGFLELIQNVAGGGAGVSEDFDVDAYNHRTVAAYQDLEVDMLLGQFAMVRERTAAVVGGLHDEQLEQRGRHPHLGDASLDEMIRLIYHHNNLHLRDVRHALRSEAARSEAARSESARSEADNSADGEAAR